MRETLEGAVRAYLAADDALIDVQSDDAATLAQEHDAERAAEAARDGLRAALDALLTGGEVGG